MILSYLKTQYRIIRNRKIYYAINVLGLALGIASSILIMLWILDELSYEKMHENAGHIMLVHKRYNMGEKVQVNASLPQPLAESLELEFPEITHAVRVAPRRGFVRSGEEVYNENTMCAADPDYFDIFSFNFIKGDPATALSEPYSIVLTREKAIKYFGQEEALGKVLELEGKDKYTVTGIIEDIEANTYLNYDMVVPFETIHKPGSDNDSWYNHFLNTYIYVDNPDRADSLDARLTSHLHKYMTSDNTIELVTQPIRDRHLYDITAQNTRAMYIYIFSVIGFLVLLIGCINFTNVSTFVSLKRSREIGVRKINGAGRITLVGQFLGETFHQALAGFLLAMMLVELIRPQFNQLTGKSISIPYLEPYFILALAGLLLLTTLLAGSYPAILISAFRPVDAFHGRIITGKGQARFRTILLVFQFTISVGLIITTLTIFNQLGYIQSKNLGFDKENLVYLSLGAAHRDNYDVFREKLLSHSGIEHVCRASSLPNSIWNIVRGMSWEGQGEEDLSSFAFLSGDEDLVETLGLEIISGRDFSREYSLDSTRIVVNEEAAKLMGFKDPVGKAIISDTTRIEIIGLLKDFHGLPLTEIPFEFNFVDEKIDQQYRSEIRVGKLSGAFTILAILITCIGLFAIAGHTAQKKDKEIGIRKAMGASSRSVVSHFILIYIKWVVVANLIAWPLSWLLMKNWLTHFAYRTEQSPGVFFLASLISLLISVITIGWHAWNTARTNPVEALKCE
jgi:putative ABC transport system permease protein